MMQTTCSVEGLVNEIRTFIGLLYQGKTRRPVDVVAVGGDWHYCSPMLCWNK